MGYMNPNVCKEYYIPFDPSNDSGLTLDEYQQKYGIDLKEIFDIVDKSIIFKEKNAKFHFVIEGRIVEPFAITSDDYGDGYALNVMFDVAEGVTTLAWNSMLGIATYDGKLVLNYLED